MQLRQLGSCRPIERSFWTWDIARADRELWAQFEANPTAIAELAESAFESAVEPELDGEDTKQSIPMRRTETVSLVRVRLVLTFFRNSVLASDENRCAISGVVVPSLLVASHIIPWSVNEARRADPRNGVCLNSLYDKAFDGGLLTFSDDLRVVISPVLRAQSPSRFHQWALLDSAADGDRSCLLLAAALPVYRLDRTPSRLGL